MPLFSLLLPKTRCHPLQAHLGCKSLDLVHQSLANPEFTDSGFRKRPTLILAVNKQNSNWGGSHFFLHTLRVQCKPWPTALRRAEQPCTARQSARSWAAGGLARILIETNSRNSVCSQGATKIDPRMDPDPPTTAQSKKKRVFLDEISNYFHDFPLSRQLFSVFTSLHHTRAQKQHYHQLSLLIPPPWT